MGPISYLLCTFEYGADQEMRALSFNAANAHIAGYKARHMTQHPYKITIDPKRAPTPAHITYPVDGFMWKDEHQGPLKRTNNPLDVAVKGPGLITLTDGTYTRNGKMILTPEGILTTPSGHEIAGLTGETLQMTGNIQDLRIMRNGQIINSNNETLGQIQLTEFDEHDNLKKIGENRIDGSEAGPRPAQQTFMLQGFYEESNVRLQKTMAKAHGVVTNHHQAILMNKEHYRSLDDLRNHLVQINA
ncbi:hypothetical protein [Candidatus Hepatobacter penaei]|uniref:hypothetical protein n=1 Tax=Candidatus Hepatobacter penaei TaxID=1274402 RepID=UPI0010940AF1|nr:hypothetical protein [Candidatus Hepatobacter penaei]TGW15698.1 hypothetical protein EIL50_01120 [bacterium NHP-B]